MSKTIEKIQAEIDDNIAAIESYENILKNSELMRIADSQGLPIRNNMKLCKEAIDKCKKELEIISKPKNDYNLDIYQVAYNKYSEYSIAINPKT